MYEFEHIICTHLHLYSSIQDHSLEDSSTHFNARLRLYLLPSLLFNFELAMLGRCWHLSHVARGGEAHNTELARVPVHIKTIIRAINAVMRA